MDIKVNLNMIKIEKLLKRAEDTNEKVAEAMLEDMKEKDLIPVKSGRLSESGHVVKDNENVSIVFDTPYAESVYYDPMKPKHLWMDSYINGSNKDFTKNEFEKLFDKGGL